jgi:hypothetical protein
MRDTAGTGDPHVVGVDSGTLPGRADVVRDGWGTGTGAAAPTGTPAAGPTNPWREGRER